MGCLESPPYTCVHASAASKLENSAVATNHTCRLERYGGGEEHGMGTGAPGCGFCEGSQEAGAGVRALREARAQEAALAAGATPAVVLAGGGAEDGVAFGVMARRPGLLASTGARPGPDQGMQADWVQLQAQLGLQACKLFSLPDMGVLRLGRQRPETPPR
eukprot:358690-Chlamydomonas_euryale.AAC.5